MATIPFLAIPTAALAVARDETERLFVLALWEHADRIQGPFPASSRWLQDLGSMGAGKVSRLMSRLEAVAVVSTVTPGTRTGDPSIIACWRPKKRNTSRNTSAPIADTPRGTPQTPTGSGSQTDHRNTSRNTSEAPRGTPRGTKNTELTTERSTEREHPPTPQGGDRKESRAQVDAAWVLLEGVRQELHRTPSGRKPSKRPITDDEARGLSGRLKELRTHLAEFNGLNPDRPVQSVGAVVEAGFRWVYTSDTPNARGMRSTKDVRESFLRKCNFVSCCMAALTADERMTEEAKRDIPAERQQDASTDEAERVEAWNLARQLFESGAAFCVDPGPLESFGRADNVIRLERG